MSTQVLRGKIEPLALIDVLAYLGRSKASGALRVSRENTEKSIIISEGTIIFARSNLTADRLGDSLLAQNLITQAQYDKATAIIYERGIRHGRALVEIGALSPRQLWHAIQEQVRTIACSVIPWEDGQFEFFRQVIKKKESITVKWPIMDMVQDVIRNLSDASLFRKRFRMNEMLTICKERGSNNLLEPHEEHLLQFIDGETRVSQICEVCDYGEQETLRVLYLLKSLGIVEGSIEDGPMSDIPVHPMVENFNKIFVFLYGYLQEAVGKVGADLLEKYFSDTRTEHPQVFGDVNLMEDGSLNRIRIQANLDKLEMSDDELLVTLDDAMNEYLNVCILAVAKLLGSEHEAIVIDKIAEFV